MGLNWLTYTERKRSYLQISRNMTSGNVKQRWNQQRMTFWTSRLPKMIEGRCLSSAQSLQSTTIIIIVCLLLTTLHIR